MEVYVTPVLPSEELTRPSPAPPASAGLPSVTILIAVYNEEKHIAKCLTSLLGQSYRAVEIVVIDDGSTDGTSAIVNQFPSVRLLKQAHLGKAKAINRGAVEATGSILFFLDGDMYFDADYVARMVEPIREGRTSGTSHAQEYVANTDNPWAVFLQLKSGMPARLRLQLGPAEIERGCTIYRAILKQRFLEVGGFDDTGFFDDQTLYPKLNERAVYVEGAVCYHHNPETLGEVFRAGIWGGKSLARIGGWGGLMRYSPLFTVPRAAWSAFRAGLPLLFLYDLVRETGIFYGMFKMLAKLDSTYGK
jgi:glycosyltransferase involved in cell wall biosynthesis